MDIRWLQRFSNYQKAFSNLSEFVAADQLNKFEQQGLIQAFEYTYELAWKTLKDFLENEGYKEIGGPKSVIKLAFKEGLIQNGEAWADMHTKRNLTVHTYNQNTADEIASEILNSYYQLFRDLKIELSGRNQNNKHGLPITKLEKFKKLVSAEFHEIKKIELFGSRAKGNHKTGSDIDLTLKGENISLQTLTKLNQKAEEIWFPYTTDIVIFNQINEPKLIEHIKRVGITIFERN